MTRLSMSFSFSPGRTRPSPQSNSLCMRRASTTVAMQSMRGIPSSVYFCSMLGMEQMVCAMGPGSQMPLASMTI